MIIWMKYSGRIMMKPTKGNLILVTTIIPIIMFLIGILYKMNNSL